MLNVSCEFEVLSLANVNPDIFVVFNLRPGIMYTPTRYTVHLHGIGFRAL